MKQFPERPRHCQRWSPPARGAWIETTLETLTAKNNMSPPARGAWIETYAWDEKRALNGVAPRAGGVD